MFVTGILIHEKILDPVYQANESFWLAELRQDPPDMAALMPQWLLTSFVSSLVVAGIYSLVGGSFSGPGWSRGLKWGPLPWNLQRHELFRHGRRLRPTAADVDLVGNRRLDPVHTLGGAAMGWAGERFAGS